MEESNFLPKVKEVIGGILHLEDHEIEQYSTLEGLGLDSLDCVEVVIELEKDYNINISDESAESFRTVKDITDYLEKQITNG